jgi:hypothetical protein
MRELAKSMVGFSWAVGLFGLQQFTRALTPQAAPPDVTASELDDVARAAAGHLSDQYAQQFRAGDDWQRRVIDIVFDAASMRSFDPRNIASTFDPRPLLNDVDPRKLFQSGVDLFQKSVDAVRNVATPPTTQASTTTGG